MAGAPSISRESLRAELDDARRATDALFAVLRPEAIWDRPITERHRFLFYVGHLEVFDWNLLWRDALKRPAKNPKWEQLFSFGIDPVDGQLPSDTEKDWPSVDEVHAWVRELRTDVNDVIATSPYEGHIAIEHRWMHFETLSYMLHQVPLAKKEGHRVLHGLDHPAPRNEWKDVPAGHATLGLDRAHHPFLGWDNEYQRHEVEVPAFRVQKFPTSNADFLRFVEGGGYAQRSLWTDADWAWKETHHVSHPAFWKRDGDRWQWRTMFEDVALPASWPVWVSLAEARAYAKWIGASLPSEAQWHRAAYGSGRPFPWGDETPNAGLHGNFGGAQFDPTPIDAHPAGASHFGVEDLLGNGWEWTSTTFAPFAGFEPLPFYLGYSANFFDGQHFVMKGGGPRTAPSMLRPSFRNWFQPHYPYVHASFRCVEE